MKTRRVILAGLLVGVIAFFIGLRIYMSRMPARMEVFSDQDLREAHRRAGFTNEPPPPIVQVPIDYSKRVRVSIGTLGLKGEDDQNVAALTLANLNSARGVEMIEREELEKALHEIHMQLDGFVRAKDALDVLVCAFGMCAILIDPSGVWNHNARLTSYQNACINNLRLIDAAKQQWFLEYHRGPHDIPAPSDLTPYLGRGANGDLPNCPSSDSTNFESNYYVGAIEEKPTCKIAPNKHILP